MASVGERLRRAREEQALALSQVAGEIRINSRYLGAIESGDLSQLPGGFFARSFVRQYAERLGVPMEEIQSDLDRWLAESTADAAPSLEPKTMKTGLPPVTHVVEGGRRPRRKVLGAVLTLVVVIGGCAAVYSYWLQRQKEPPLPQLVQEPASPVDEPEAPPMPAATESAPAPEVAIPADQPEPAAPTATEPAEAGVEGPLWFEVAAIDEVWVRVKTGDETLYVGILNSGETRRFSGLRLATVRIGNAGGLRVRVNGRDLGPLGPRGQIRILTLTPDKTEITAPERLRPPIPDGTGEADLSGNSAAGE